MKAEFDTVADRYLDEHRKNIAASGDDPEYFARYKIEDIAADRISRGLSNDSALNIVDFGGGIGNSVSHLRHFFPNAQIFEVDVSKRSLEISEGLNGSAAKYVLYDGVSIPIEDGSVDFALAACVFHHIPQDEHVATIREIRRTLRSGGDLYIFEHNPWNPLTRHAVNTCPFDENAVLISGFEMAKRVNAGGLQASKPIYRYFFPAPLARFRPLERYLRSAPIGAQYFVRGVNVAQ